MNPIVPFFAGGPIAIHEVELDPLPSFSPAEARIATIAAIQHAHLPRDHAWVVCVSDAVLGHEGALAFLGLAEGLPIPSLVLLSADVQALGLMGAFNESRPIVVVPGIRLGTVHAAEIAAARMRLAATTGAKRWKRPKAKAEVAKKAERKRQRLARRRNRR